jgi:hypothetical protein
MKLLMGYLLCQPDLSYITRWSAEFTSPFLIRGLREFARIVLAIREKTKNIDLSTCHDVPSENARRPQLVG